VAAMKVRGFGTRQSLVSAGIIVITVKMAVTAGVIVGTTTVDNSPSTPPVTVNKNHVVHKFVT
jgi:hypothetical protein